MDTMAQNQLVDDALRLLGETLEDLDLNGRSLINALAGQGNGHGWFNRRINRSVKNWMRGVTEPSPYWLRVQVHIVNLYGGRFALIVKVENNGYPEAFEERLRRDVILRLKMPSDDINDEDQLITAQFSLDGTAVLTGLEADCFTDSSRLTIGWGLYPF